ncbi:diguanylate cyclase (GGDEF)-like protein [Luteibacter sp. Sphag1AF]|uniref:GGDEF domain-containing protein n=1 Tax=Luteibacter sp. Sphag1AF TaxID=2587031 RepID=UPI00160B2A04|nr:GGDEF domain-containing protein [Luteibacter sp. Sphag1AF]MBB3228316.1 diguanylate cyclase (GGDEF)-like protein [Luteibacter sp. Sphag1AF]
MTTPWPTPSRPLPESRLLASVAEFTHHRDIDALDHSLVLSLAELVNVGSVALCKRGDDPHRPIESLVVCERNAEGQLAVNAADPEHTSVAVHSLVHSMTTLESISESTSGGAYRVIVPVQREHVGIGALMLQSNEPLDEVRPLADGFARIYSNYIALLNESERDKLTGLYNRRSFEQRLRRLLKAQYRHRENAGEERRAPEHPSRVWLALLDIDHFKRINDTYGHVYGDEVILLLAQQMRASFRQSDVLFRFGGEEFVMLITADNEHDALAMLDRFRRHIADHVYPQVGHVTVSIGYASIGENDYPEIVLDRADKALYFAKQNGRNAVHSYEDLTERGELVTPVPVGSIDLF